MTAAAATRVLLVHNAYQHRGGEDAVVEAEAELLRSRGHAVSEYTRTNHDITELPKADLLTQTIWSRRTVAEIGRRIAEFAPDVVHVHNTFPLVSPSVYWAASRAGVPVVQTLHNFRLLCPQAILLRESRVCEDCVGRFPWRGAARACYRGSHAQSAVLVATLAAHRGLGTYRTRVSRYIALNDFCRRKFIEGGLPAERIAVKGNFVDLPAPAPGERHGGVYVGRLSEEKGVTTLAQALHAAPGSAIDVIGSGPLEAELAAAPGARMLGWASAAQVYGRMATARFLVLPSICYESFPRALVEAFACATPVIASRLGALADLVRDGVTGLLFDPGNPRDLAQKLSWAREHPHELATMGANARAEYEANYTPDHNYRQLAAIYAQALEERRGEGKVHGAQGTVGT